MKRPEERYPGASQTQGHKGIRTLGKGLSNVSSTGKVKISEKVNYLLTAELGLWLSLGGTEDMANQVGDSK